MMVAESSIRVLIVDDEPGMLQAIQDYLSIVHSISVEICNSASDALTREDLFSFDCLIVDYEMPDIDGIVLLKEIRAMHPDIPIIIFTGKGHEEVAMNAINAGADYYIKKGGNPEELFAELAHYIRKGVRRYRAETALVENEKRYRAVVEDLTEFVCRMDATGEIRFVNPAFCTHLGKTLESLIGLSFYSFYPTHHTEIDDAILLCDPDNPSAQIELPYASGYAETIWHQWVMRAIFNERFDVLEMQAVGRDISKKREQERQSIILRDLGLTLASCSSLESALTFSLSAACDISTLESGAVYLRDRGTGRFSLFLDQGPYRAALGRLIEDLKRDGFQEPIFTAGTPGYMSMTDMRRFEGPFTSLALVPIQRYGEVNGWFVLASDTRIEVPVDARSPLEGVASQIGNVISRIEAEEALRDALIESEERYMQLSESSPDAIAILTGRNFVYLNPAALLLFETESLDDFVQLPMNQYLDDSLKSWFDGIMRTTERGQGPSTGEGFLRSKTGKMIYGELVTVPISHAGEEAFLLIIRDKTGQRLQELALIESEKRFREMADLLPEPLFETDLSGRLTFCNRGVLALLGIDTPNEEQCMAADLVSAGEQLRFSTLMRKVATDMIPITADFQASGRAGEDRSIHLSLAPIIRDGQFCGTRGVFVDITEIKRYQERLHHMIEEKDVLFRELHHRVKNNMQIISSMLQLQEEYISDEVILSALHDCEQRIDSMALVHETLYRTESLADIPFNQYLQDLAQAVTEGFATVRDIRAEIDVGGIRLGLDTAVTIGLIVNELMVNSMKYAFVDRPSGTILIHLACEDTACTLRYADDGVGLPEGFDIEKISSLGMRLVRILAKQIRGKLEVRNGPDSGMECIVIFPT